MGSSSSRLYFSVLPKDLVLSLLDYIDVFNLVRHDIDYDDIKPFKQIINKDSFWTKYWKTHVSSIVQAPPNRSKFVRQILFTLLHINDIRRQYGNDEYMALIYEGCSYARNGYNKLLYHELWHFIENYPERLSTFITCAAGGGQLKMVKDLFYLKPDHYIAAIEIAQRDGFTEIANFLSAYRK